MKAGNTIYDGPEDIPPVAPVFPLSPALLLPRGQMPLNVFEPRYLAMVDAAMRGDRVVGIIQPRPEDQKADRPALCDIGCLGRITSYAETGDGRYMITLTGIARFRVIEEVDSATLFRQCRISAEEFREDFVEDAGADAVDRKALLATFRSYLEAHGLQADWESIGNASNETLVNALAMMSPYGPAEKQALLEAPDLRSRAETLVALTEIELARGGDTPSQLQ